MRIVVSGTHASGKSTVISDFARRHPEFAVLPDPFELIDEMSDTPSAASFAAQLRVAADRLTDRPHRGPLIAERGPLDFLAYLLALAEIGEARIDRGTLERATQLTSEALETVDLVAVIPLAASAPIHVGPDEHLELRQVTDDILMELIDDPDLDVDADSVLVLQNAGPRGYPGMPEVGTMALPKKLLAAGVTDMVRVSDARMSGTAFGTVVLHVAPESALGGPLALVKTGDMIVLDTAGRRIDVEIDAEEMARRRAAFVPPEPAYERGYGKLFIDHVQQADKGVDFDFLVGSSGTPPSKVSF